MYVHLNFQERPKTDLIYIYIYEYVCICIYISFMFVFLAREVNSFSRLYILLLLNLKMVGIHNTAYRGNTQSCRRAAMGDQICNARTGGYCI